MRQLWEKQIVRHAHQCNIITSQKKLIKWVLLSSITNTLALPSSTGYEPWPLVALAFDSQAFPSLWLLTQRFQRISRAYPTHTSPYLASQLLLKP